MASKASRPMALCVSTLAGQRMGRSGPAFRSHIRGGAGVDVTIVLEFELGVDKNEATAPDTVSKQQGDPLHWRSVRTLS